MLKKCMFLLFLPVWALALETVPVWDYYEIQLKGPSKGNPFQDIWLEAMVESGETRQIVPGFYDGNGRYLVRFMPDRAANWHYAIRSNSESLNGKSGEFQSIPSDKAVHGMVQVDKGTHFRYSDGTPYYPFGTTLYSWIHMPDSIQQKTLKTLARAPFNKVRMCVFPQDLFWHDVPEPERHAFEGKPLEFDYSRFNPDYFRHLEKRILQLRDMGIECDLIIWHPYDKGRWGYDLMTDKQDDVYLRYLMARVGAFRNIWWSLANEYDLMENKQIEDWDRHFQIIQNEDPYQHLRSIHQCKVCYDHQKPWVSHVSLQKRSTQMREYVHTYHKPVIVDECYYEGNIPFTWGDITAQDMTLQFWDAMTKGGYASHGETYLNANNIIWWSQGGELKGRSIARIAFLRKLIEALPDNGLQSFNGSPIQWNRLNSVRLNDDCMLFYFQDRQPGVRSLALPKKRNYSIEIIDTWEMKITQVNGTFSGNVNIELPSKPYIALKVTAID